MNKEKKLTLMKEANRQFWNDDSNAQEKDAKPPYSQAEINKLEADVQVEW